MTVGFSEAISGFDLADLKLARDGGSNLLTGAQTLTTTDNITWTLGGIAGLTGTSGSYVLTLTASGSGITDLVGNPLVYLLARPSHNGIQEAEESETGGDVPINDFPLHHPDIRAQCIEYHQHHGNPDEAADNPEQWPFHAASPSTQLCQLTLYLDDRRGITNAADQH
jgi:hypothetical protein